MKNKDLLSFKGAVQHPVSVPYLSRVSLDSILSRLCLASLICLCLMTIGVGNVWGDDSYTITFANNVKSATELNGNTKASTVIAQASRSYVTTSPFTVNSGNIYYGDTQTCIRVGKSGSNASLTIALSSTGQVSATRIVVNCQKMSGNKNSSATIGVNGTDKQFAPSSANNLTFTINDKITNITLETVTAVQVFSITVYYTSAASCSTGPTVGAASNSSVTVTGGTVSCTGITKGDCDIDEWGFVYGTATGPTGNAQKVSSGKSTSNVSAFNKTLTGLDPNTKYYARAYAKVGSNTFYGTETNFMTKTITASSSSTTYGTVSRSKMVITGSPKSGCQYASPAYTISGSTPANATTVSQSGNTFTVTSTSTTDITVTINFEAIPTYTVIWVAGSNSSFSTQTNVAGTALTNPGTPSATSYCPGGKEFVGWTATPIAGEQNSAPADLFTSVSGMSIPAENKTYYAVFAKVTTTYTKITTEADFTSGNYLVVNTANSKAMKAEIYSSNYLAAADVTISATTISNPAASLIWEVKKDGTTYTLYNTSVSKYCDIVANGSYGKMSLTASSKGFTASVSSGNWSLSSNNISGQMIQYNSSYTEFQAFSAIPSGYEIQLYKQGVSAYATTCASCTATPTVGDASLKGAFSLGSVGVTVTGCSAGENCAWEDYGFVWGTSDNPTVANNKVQVGTSGGATAWEGTLTAEEFTPGTTYHFRAYGKNGKADGTYTYSTDQSFTPRSITFNLNGHGSSTPATQYVNNGGKATDPNYSEAVAGWTFGGWYKEAACTNAWNFASDVASGSNVELYAKWTEKPKYTVTLDAGNGSIGTAGWTNTSSSVYTKTQANGDESITLPTPSCNCSGWVFQGWSTTSKSNAASFTPDKTDGASFVPANDVTYFAVYRQSTAGGNTYNKITSAGDLTTGDYVITGMYRGTTPYKMDGSLYNEGVSLGESSASVTDGSLTESTASYVWTIIKFGSSVVFRNTSTSKFLAIVDGKFALQDEGQLFTYSVTSGAWTFTSPSGKQIIYETRYNVGDSQNREIHLYKQGSTPSGNFYSNPTCSDLSITGIANPAAGGSVTLSATSAKSGEKVYAYYTEDPAYRFNSWEISGTGASISSTSTQLTEITVGTADVTLTANFDARVMYSVTWKANGEELTGSELGSASTSVETGEKITNLPPTPSSCETGSGKSDIFVGWCTKDWNGYKNTTGEFPTGAVLFTSTDDAPIVTDNVTYYAVWAQVGSTSYNYTLDFAISASVSSATAFSNFKTGLTNASANNTYYDVDNIVLGGTVYQETGTNGQIGPRLGSGSGVGSIEMPLLSAGKVAVTSIVANVKGYGDNNTNFDLTAYFSDGTSEKKTLPSESEYITTTATDYTASYSNYKTLTKIKIESNTNKKRLYVCSITVNYKQMTKYLTTCCNTPTLAFEASSYAVLRQDLQGASTTTWAEVDVTFTTNNTTGTISVPDYDSGKSVYKLSAWESRATSGGTLCAKDHAYLEVLTQPSGSTPGTGKFHVKTTSGHTGQGTYRIAITQAATDESHGNYCETTVYGFVDVTLRDKFVDKVNGNGTINRDGHGSQLGTPTLSEFGTQVEDACHSEGRKLKGWIKETDLKAQYETGANATRVQTVDGLCETCAAGTDQTSLIVAPGANVTMSGATWYAVWAYEK